MNIFSAISLVAYLAGVVLHIGIVRVLVQEAKAKGYRVAWWRTVAVPLAWPVIALLALGEGMAKKVTA